jgi:septal ring factor EnvC (AmiA/AmiB activator)
MSDARPFWRQLGVDYFGMTDPMVEVRRERSKRFQALQETITKAAAFEQLTKAPGYKQLLDRWQEMQAQMTRQLITASPKDLLALQAQLKAFEAAVNIVPDAIREANHARNEVEKMLQEDFGEEDQ